MIATKAKNAMEKKRKAADEIGESTPSPKKVANKASPGKASGQKKKKADLEPEAKVSGEAAATATSVEEQAGQAAATTPEVQEQDGAAKGKGTKRKRATLPQARADEEDESSRVHKVCEAFKAYLTTQGKTERTTKEYLWGLRIHMAQPPTVTTRQQKSVDIALVTYALFGSDEAKKGKSVHTLLRV
jgi:hypothetical protein